MGTKKGAGQTAPTMEKPKPTEQAKNASIQADTDAHALPEITVRIDKLFCDEDKKLKAFASANIGPFAVHGIRVFENDKGCLSICRRIPTRMHRATSSTRMCSIP